MSGPVSVIIIMGQTGVGKSQFINRAVGEDVAEVNHDLEAKMAEPRVYNAKSVYLVDTPGFDDTNDANDIVTLNRMVNWFKNSRTSSNIASCSFCGVLYLVEHKQRNFPMLQGLKEVNQRLLIVMTKGGGKRKDIAVDCLFPDSHDSAWDVIRAVLEKEVAEDIPVPLFFQKLGKVAESLPKSKPSRRKFSWKGLFGLR